jgi:predicted DNA-binding transcriptional regulator YafY
MSAQIERCIKILSVLSGGHKLSTQEIIQKVTHDGLPHVTQRQIQRDLRSIEQAGVPLTSERTGREQRWYIPTSYRGLQPLTVTSQEVLSLHLLKGALGAYRNTRVQADVERLQRTLDRVVPGTVFLGNDVVSEVSPGRYTSAIDDEVMDRIIFAITDPHWDRVTYRSIHGGQTKTFVVSFCRMINHAGRLYVAAWHPTHKQYITLAVDRIDHVERAEDTTLPHHVFDEHKYKRARFGVYDGDVHAIRLRIDASAADFFASRLWHPSQSVTRRARGSLDLTLEAPLSPELVSWIVSWSDVITIISPRKLKTICRDKVKRLFVS